MKIAIFGGTGFIGRSLTESLSRNGNTVVAISSRETDPRDPAVRKKLSLRLAGYDACISCMMVKPSLGLPKEEGWKQVREDNLRLAKAFGDLTTKLDIPRILYLSSDAVYPYQSAPVNERSPLSAVTEYARTHVAAEEVLSNSLGDRLTICRLTQVYGAANPHNAYGPCRMIHSALKTGRIILFGNGEEFRDHISIDSITHILSRLSDMNAPGIINIATGTSVIFLDIAESICDLLPGVTIERQERVQEIIHRHMDVPKLRKLVPDHRGNGILKTLPKLIAEMRTLQGTTPIEGTIC